MTSDSVYVYIFGVNALETIRQKKKTTTLFVWSQKRGEIAFCVSHARQVVSPVVLVFFFDALALHNARY